MYRRERYLEKTKAISATISHVKLLTFKDVCIDVSQGDKKKEREKESAESQRIVAKEQNYDLKDLLQYDLVMSLPLFDKYGLMKKNIKVCTLPRT